MNPVAGLGLRILLWLPILFGAWYFSSIIFVLPMAKVLDALMVGLFPDVIASVRAVGNELMVQTLVQAKDAARPGAVGEIVLMMNPLKYGYSLPLYTALVLASPSADWDRAWSWILGALILFGLQVFGLGAEMIKILAFDLPEESGAVLGLSRVGYNAAALAYQFGYLILPPVTPIVLWLWQFRSILSPLTGWSESGRQGPTSD